jgi:hypothetical protein
MLVLLLSAIVLFQGSSNERWFQFLTTTGNLLRWEQRFEDRPVQVGILGAPELSMLAVSRNRTEFYRKKHIQFVRLETFADADVDVLFISNALTDPQLASLTTWALEKKCVLISAVPLPEFVPAVHVFAIDGRIRWKINTAVFEAGLISLDNPLARASLTPTVASL